MTIAERLSTLRTVADYVATFLMLERSLLPSDGPGQVQADFGPWDWLQVFDDDDLAEFMAEMREAIIGAARDESCEQLDDTLHRWQVTARVLADPLRRTILLEPHTDEEFVEVTAVAAAEILAVAPQTVRNWVRAGLVPGRRDARGRFYVRRAAMENAIGMRQHLPDVPAGTISDAEIDAEIEAARAERRVRAPTA